jgi:hypothetical protein
VAGHNSAEPKIVASRDVRNSFPPYGLSESEPQRSEAR